MNISGKMKIFRNEFNGRVFYTTSLTNKLENGNYEYMNVAVQFPKDTVIENKTDIDVIKGFMTFFKDKNGIEKPKAVIQEWILDTENYNNSDDSTLPF